MPATYIDTEYVDVHGSAGAQASWGTGLSPIPEASPATPKQDDEPVLPSPNKRYRVKTPAPLAEPTLVPSPKKRHTGKQPPQMELRRNPKLCQMAECVYNCAQPGQPAIARDTNYCVWCDPELMATALNDTHRRGNVKVTLSIFEK